MKSPGEVLADVERRLTRTWAETVVAGDQSLAWPHDFPLGTPTGTALDQESGLFDWVRSWADLSTERGTELRHATRLYRATKQTVPTHLVVSTIDAAAQLVGLGWPDRLASARDRHDALLVTCPKADIDEATLTVINGYGEADFALLLEAARWFQENAASGLTPRQVPIVGMHSKWLDSVGRRDLICRLSGLDALGLDERRPHAVSLTYLDPHQRATGRLHDSIVPGDNARPAFPPRLLIICENRDSAVFFPEVVQGIAIQGAGNEGPTRIKELLDVGWIPLDSRLVYWGDMDARGYEIVNDYRARGVAMTTILMDFESVQKYSEVGVPTIPPATITRRHLRHLTDGETAAYYAVTSGAEFPQRIEQERIPLRDALAAIDRLMREPPDPL